MTTPCCLLLYFHCISVSLSEVFYLPLTHSLSKTQFISTHHLLKSISTHFASPSLFLSLSPGSDYTLSFTLNTNPPQHVSLYFDTGSDIVWFPCWPFECILCDGKPDNTTTASSLLPKLSFVARTINCKSSACSAAHSNVPTSDLCVIANCLLESIETSDCRSFSCPSFYYAYGDGGLIACLYHAIFSFFASIEVCFKQMKMR